MSTAYLFYAGQLVLTMDCHINSIGAVSHHIYHKIGQEFYNGGYLYLPDYHPQWFRPDLTPVLLEDVPKELRLLVLLNN